MYKELVTKDDVLYSLEIFGSKLNSAEKNIIRDIQKLIQSIVPVESDWIHLNDENPKPPLQEGVLICTKDGKVMEAYLNETNGTFRRHFGWTTPVLDVIAWKPLPKGKVYE